MKFIDKFNLIISNPKKFFKSVEKGKGYLEPWIYYVIVMSIYLFLSAIASIPSMMQELSTEFDAFGAVFSGIFSIVIIFIIFFIILLLSSGMIFIGAGIQHLFLLLVGTKKRYIETFKLLCYSTTPVVFLSVFIFLEGIPMIGGILYIIGTIIITIYLFYIEVLGAKILHKLSTLRSVIAIVIIPTIIGLIILAFVITLLLTVFNSLGITGMSITEFM